MKPWDRDTVHQIQSGDCAIPTRNTAHQHVYIFGQVRSDEGKVTRAKILLDSGNLTKIGVVISDEFRKKMGLGLAKVGGRRVGTAGAGLGMTRIGMSQPFDLKIPGLRKVFRVKQAIVLKELTDEINLGTSFLQKVQEITGKSPSLKFHAKGTSLNLGNESVELIKKVIQCNRLEPDGGPGVKRPAKSWDRQPSKKARVEKAKGPGDQYVGITRRSQQMNAMESQVPRARPGSIGRRSRGAPIFAGEDTQLKAQSLTFVRTHKLSGGALVEAVPLGYGAEACAVTAVYDGINRVAILNQGGHKVLPKGTQIGEMFPLQLAELEGQDEAVKEVRDEPGELNKLYKDLKLDENELLGKHPKMLSQVKAMIKKYKEVFSSPEQAIGKTNLMEFDVTLTEGARPVKQRVRPLNPKQKESLRAQLDLWEKEDVIERCESPWASAMVPALKKGGTIRWAVDYRGLNAVTVADAYPLPNIGENLDNLQGSRVYSTLDASAAYNTIPVAKRARPLLAFVTPFGSFCFKRMPFGAKNAGATYSRFIDLLIEKLRSPHILAYVDDVIVHTPNLDLHMRELEKALQMHLEAGIKLNAGKTHLFQPSAEYLGYEVDANGIHMQEGYVERILQWPVPKTVKQLASFLGFTGYYRSFISQYAQLTTEMNSQKKKKVLEWTPEMDAKFKILKDLFSRKPIRAYPRFGEDEAMFVVTPDWSIDAVGVILEQEQDGQMRFVAAAGRKTTPGERNYPPTKGELSGIIYALRKFEHILRYKKFVIYCDHQPLQWLQKMKNPRGIYWRWLAELATYDFEIRYKPGKQVGAADGLSRSPHMEDPTLEEVAESEEFVGHLRQGTDDVNEAVMDRAHIKRSQEDDDILQIVRRWVKGKPPENKEELRGLPEDAHVYHKLLRLLHEDEEGVLLRRGAEEGQPDRILVPSDPEIRKEVFYWSHEHPSAGHFGCNATSLRACQKFYWPGMTEFLKRKVKNCGTCLAKIQKTHLHHTVHKPRRHGYPGEVLYVDLVGPLPETARGNKYIVTMMDGFTKYVAAVTIPCKEAPVVANAVIEGWITKFGCPGRIHTDQGKEFVNKIWTQLCDRLQITKTVTPAYSPQGNLVERFHRSLNQIMRVYMSREDKSWERYVDTACLAYNTKVNTTTGVTPHEAWTGRPAKLPIDLVIPMPRKSYDNEDSYVTDTLRRFEVMYAAMRKRAEDTFKRNARLYSGNTEEFNVGDLVWVFSKRKVEGKPMKITDAWMGPYKVVGHTSEVTLQVRPAETSGRIQTVHITTVRRFHPTGCTGLKYRPPRDPVESEDGDELAEELGRPPRMVEPADQVTTGVPIQYAVPQGEIVDMTEPREGGSTAGAGPGARPLGASSKRDLSPEVEKPQVKRGKRQGMKRGRESDGESQRPSGKWKQLANTDQEEDSSAADMELSSEDERINALQEERKPPDPEGINVLVPDGVRLPTSGSQGGIVWNCVANQSLTLQPGMSTGVNTGMRLALPEGHALLLLSLPRLALQGITVPLSIISPDYRGLIQVVLQNNTTVPRRVQKGEHICQAIVIPIPGVQWQRVTALPYSDRSHEALTPGAV